MSLAQDIVPYFSIVKDMNLQFGYKKKEDV